MAQKKYTGVKDIAYYQKKFWKIFFLGLGGVFLFFVFANFGVCLVRCQVSMN
jgi:penicillin-binding protein 1A